MNGFLMIFIRHISIKFEEVLNFDHALQLCTEIDKLAKEKSVSVYDARISPIYKKILIEIDCGYTDMNKDIEEYFQDKIVNLLKSKNIVAKVNIRGEYCTASSFSPKKR